MISPEFQPFQVNNTHLLHMQVVPTGIGFSYRLVLSNTISNGVGPYSQEFMHVAHPDSLWTAARKIVEVTNNWFNLTAAREITKRAVRFTREPNQLMEMPGPDDVKVVVLKTGTLNGEMYVYQLEPVQDRSVTFVSPVEICQHPVHKGNVRYEKIFAIKGIRQLLHWDLLEAKTAADKATSEDPEMSEAIRFASPAAMAVRIHEHCKETITKLEAEISDLSKRSESWRSCTRLRARSVLALVQDGERHLDELDAHCQRMLKLDYQFLVTDVYVAAGQAMAIRALLRDMRTALLKI